MSIHSITRHVLIAGALVAMPVAATAQSEDVNDQANAIAEQAQELQQEANQLTNITAEETQLAEETAVNETRRDDDDDDDDFPWGLLGLLGLAGLLGLKKGDDRRDVHVDARRDGDRDNRM